jgi:NNP family nitrate/nitrite transporter-like MFS transporter
MAEAVAEPKSRSGKEWLESWDPEGPDWDERLAWRTLAITTFNLILCFIVWFLVSAIAPMLNELGFNISQQQLYWLTAMPGLAGGLLRMVWMFLPPVIGTRKLVTYTTALLLVPIIGWSLAVQNPDTPYWVLLLFSFFTGIGGGAFAGFMPSTSYFFPRAKAGTALGIQGGVGNFGVSIVQLATPWIVGFMLLGGAFSGIIGDPQQLTDATTGEVRDVWYQNAGYAWSSLTVLGVILSWLLLKSVRVGVSRVRDQLGVFRNKHTWIMTLMYVVTFGAFSGFAAVFALLIRNIYGTSVFGDDGINPVQYAFLGALIGSAARVAFGPVADKLGGGRVTMVACIGITVSCAYTALQLSPESADEFPKFLWGMLAIFFFSGMGNASTFKQMPSIFERSQSGTVIGFTSAVAAFGPFFFSIILVAVPPAFLFWWWVFCAANAAAMSYYYYGRTSAEKPS